MRERGRHTLATLLSELQGLVGKTITGVNIVDDGAYVMIEVDGGSTVIQSETHATILISEIPKEDFA